MICARNTSCQPYILVDDRWSERYVTDKGVKVICYKVVPRNVSIGFFGDGGV